ncbi:hypothetical protein N0V90_003646 [Kalmusia sp. IMI 367209]|nr:hypothetical protein N0V90_003646 [Kalmusia sp. IMI 367209]
MSSNLDSTAATRVYRITADEWAANLSPTQQLYDGARDTGEARPLLDFHQRPEPRIRKAVEHDNVKQLQVILETVKTGRLLDNGKLYQYDWLLRLSLLRSAELGKYHTTELVLKLGAKTDALPSRQSPLLRAAHRGHIAVLQLLIKYGASVDERNRNGMTILMHAACNNNDYTFHAFQILIRAGAHLDLVDNEGRTVLHHLAADKSHTVGTNLLNIILAKIKDVDAKDNNGRTALHWACATGHLELTQRLLQGPTLGLVNITSRESLGRTPLHLAVSHGRSDIVALLLEQGADVNARSAGGWTPLHIACQKAKFLGRDFGVVSKLLENGALVNAQTTTGETPLHLAAESGVQPILESLIQCPGIRLNVRDEYGNTPFSKAVKAKSMPAIHLLAPFHSDRLSPDALEASRIFKATIVDFGDYPNGKRRTDRSIFDLLYSRAIGEFDGLASVPGIRASPRPNDATHFRWINLPSNNISWAEALLTKAFIEDGDYDVDKFTAVERSIENLQRGQRFQSHYMRPLCEMTSKGLIVNPHADPPRSDPPGSNNPPIIVINTGPAALDDSQRKRKKKRKPKQTSLDFSQNELSTTQDNTTLMTDLHAGKSVEGAHDVTTKDESYRSRRRSRRNSGKASRLSSQSPKPRPSSKLLRAPREKAAGSIFVVMPYIRFETEMTVQAMDQTIRKALSLNPDSTRMMLNTSHVYQETFGQHQSQLSHQDFDIRSLSFYRKVGDRGTRSNLHKDYKAKLPVSGNRQKLSLYMVGQLWMWVFSHNLIVTSIPQQWELPEDDHLNVLEGIIKDIKNKSKETLPVKSVIDLASIIAARCVKMFDARVIKEKDYPFLDKFESAVTSTDEQVDELFREFNSDSRQASEWLKRRGRSSTNPLDESEADLDADDDTSAEPECVDRLLDINPETSLLDYIQGLRDEFTLLRTVLSNQDNLLSHLTDKAELEPPQERELRQFCQHEQRILMTHDRDIARMEQHISDVHASVTNLLDLKHRYANVFEARFARYQATDTVHQGQTIMVFTVVTVIFLPLSFVGTLFTINISDFPQGDGGEPSMTLAYVSKWVFGIGFAISVPLVVLALSYESMMRFLTERRKGLAEKWRNRRRSRFQEVSVSGLEEKDWKDTMHNKHDPPDIDPPRARHSERKSFRALAEA